MAGGAPAVSAPTGRSLEWRFIGSRIGRRTALLFLVAAGLPVLVLALLGGGSWLTHERRAAAQEAHRDARMAGLRVLDRLLLARSALQASLTAAAPLSATDRERLARSGILQATFAGPAAPPTSAPSGGAPTLLQWWWSLPPAAERSLFLQPVPGGGMSVVLRVRDAAGRRDLLAQLDSRWLWSDLLAEGAADALCVREVGGAEMGCVGRTEAAADAAALQAGWSLFLLAEFGAPAWSIELRRPDADTHVAGLAALAGQVALASLLLVALLSIVLVRRTLQPLQALTEATRQLAAGRTNVSVKVDGDDEFAQLAGDFNEMARRLEQQTRHLAHRATHDALTGLLNRHGLQAVLEQRAAQAHTGSFALLLLDLDRFSTVNDTHGHAVGDALLCLAADRLRALAPDGTLIGRHGGDEFVLLLPGAAAAAGDATAQAACAALAQPFDAAGHTLMVGASIGIACCPADGTQAEVLLRRADLAMYAAKRDGRGRPARFTVDMDEQVQLRATLLDDLRRALPAGGLRLHYQPRVCDLDGRCHAVEALVRWPHPGLGLVPPDRFIGLAEESGLIEALGAWVLDEACRQLAQWRGEGVAIERVSVNVSVHQLRPGFDDRVRTTLARHGLEGSRLELELTESVMIDRPQEIAAMLRTLGALGVGLALDDFGTGYSSMSYLRQLPLNVLKIDRSFVRDLGLDPSADDIARSIVALARALGLTLVAEGVEQRSQARQLAAWGVEEMQGFLFARPMPPEALARWLQGQPAPAAPALA